MLQKIENAYLAILRLAVIVIAGLLLVAVVIQGLNSIKAIRMEPETAKAAPTVSGQELIADVAKKATAEGEEPSEADTSTAADPNQAHFDRTAKAIASFVAKHSTTGESVDVAQVADVIKSKAAELEDAGHTAAYAKGLADLIEKTLASPSVIKAAQTTSAIHVVDVAIDTYGEKFNAQIEAVNAQNEKKLEEYTEKKAEGMQSLYVAVGAFFAFLTIIFLSVIIRIERNLRHLENKAPA